MAPTEPRSESVRWSEHLARAAEAFAAELRGVVPDDFSSHARGSIREALLAVRSLLDTGIDRLKTEEPKAPRRVEVE
jgi:hypothetical protein